MADLTNEWTGMRARVHAASWMLLAGVLGCGGGTQVEGETTPVEVQHVEVAAAPTPIEVLHPDSFALIEVDVARARNSPYYPIVWPWIVGLIEDEARDEAPRLIEALNQAIQDVDRVYASFVPRNSGSYDLGSVVVEGRFEPGEVEGWLRSAVPPERAARLTPTQIGNYRGFSMGDETSASSGALIEVSPSIWVLGPRSALEAPLANPAAPAAFSDASFLEARTRLSIAQPMATCVVLGTEEGKRLLRRDSPLERQAESARSAAVSVDATSGVQLDSIALFDSPEPASVLVGRLSELRNEAANSMPIRMMPRVSSAIESIAIQQDASDVGVAFQMPDAELRPLLETLGGFISMARN